MEASLDPVRADQALFVGLDAPRPLPPELRERLQGIVPTPKVGRLSRWLAMPIAASLVLVIASATMYFLKPPEKGIEAGPLISPSPSVSIPSVGASPKATKKPKPNECPQAFSVVSRYFAAASSRINSRALEQASPSPTPSGSESPTPSPTPTDPSPSPSPTEPSGAAMTLTMAADPNEGPPGTAVTITYTVKNTGEVLLFSIAVTDDRLGPHEEPIPSLEPGKDFTFTHPTTLGNQTVIHHGTAKGFDREGNEIASASADAALYPVKVLGGQVHPPPVVLGKTGC